MNLFTEMINREIERLGGNRSGKTKLADKLGENYSQVHRWANGQQPSFSTAAQVIGILGGDILRALPGYIADQRPERTVIYEQSADYCQMSTNSILIAGQVQAGKVSFAGEDQHYRTFDAMWSGSKYWGISTGDIVYVEVEGESMEPEYKKGEIIACRRPTDPVNLPNGMPCIFQEGDDDGFTFKILRKTDGGDLIGQPVNPKYNFVVFKRGEVQIPLIVLGKLQLEKADTVHKSPEAEEKQKLKGLVTKKKSRKGQ